MGKKEGVGPAQILSGKTWREFHDIMGGKWRVIPKFKGPGNFQPSGKKTQEEKWKKNFSLKRAVKVPQYTNLEGQERWNRTPHGKIIVHAKFI